MDRITIDGRSLTLDNVEAVARGNVTVHLQDDARRRVMACREALERLAASGAAIYGVNTGFGLLSDVRIDHGDTVRLQENLIRSHAAGVGEPFSIPVVRAMVLLRANVLAAGHSAVRASLIDSLLGLLNSNVCPVIPTRGSVGASGDLAPLAHLALTLMGEGEAFYAGRRMPSGDALAAANLKQFRLASREGLALVNGTQAMTASGTLTLLTTARLLAQADIVGALTIDALLGSVRPFDARLAALRPHPGHAASAANICGLLAGSALLASHEGCGRVQDAYSMRCIPQVHGAARDATAFVRRVLTIEVNAVTDNPIFFHETSDAVPGGNFHGQPVAAAMDFLCIALTDAASISERRTERLVNPALSGLPAFLARRPGIESGLMMAQVTAAALVAEARTLAHPASTDSIPTGAAKEDHVSMGVGAALKAAQCSDLYSQVLAVELMAAACAIDLRRPLTSSPVLENVHALVRRKVPELVCDRPLGHDIETLAGMLRAGEIAEAGSAIPGGLS